MAFSRFATGLLFSDSARRLSGKRNPHDVTEWFYNDSNNDNITDHTSAGSVVQSLLTNKVDRIGSSFDPIIKDVLKNASKLTKDELNTSLGMIGFDKQSREFIRKNYCDGNNIEDAAQFKQNLSNDLHKKKVSDDFWQQFIYINSNLIDTNKDGKISPEEQKAFENKFLKNGKTMDNLSASVRKLDNNYGFQQVNNDFNENRHDNVNQITPQNFLLKSAQLGAGEFSKSTMEFLKNPLGLIDKEKLVIADNVYGNGDGITDGIESEKYMIDKKHGNGDGIVTQEEIDNAIAAGADLKYHKGSREMNNTNSSYSTNDISANSSKGTWDKITSFLGF